MEVDRLQTKEEYNLASVLEWSRTISLRAVWELSEVLNLTLASCGHCPSLPIARQTHPDLRNGTLAPDPALSLLKGQMWPLSISLW